MNVPSLPTDNFYKFIAVAGLIGILVSVYYSEVFLLELSLKSEKLNLITKNMKVLTKKMDEQRFELVYSTTTNKKLRKCLLDKIGNEDYGLEECTKKYKKIGKTKDSHKLYKKYKAAADAFKVKQDLLSEKHDNLFAEYKPYVIAYESSKWKAGFFYVTSFIMLFYGLMNWYNRVQKLLDVKLQKEVDLLSIDESKLKRKNG